MHIVGDTLVEGIEPGDGDAEGVRLRDGSLVGASAVVLATGPRDAAKLVDELGHPAIRRIVDGLTPARIACLDVALKRLRLQAARPAVSRGLARGRARPQRPARHGAAGLARRAGQAPVPAAYRGRRHTPHRQRRRLRRPTGPRVPGLDNLYLAGDWVGPEGFLVDASMASAQRAAQLMLEDGWLSREKVAAGSVG